MHSECVLKSILISVSTKAADGKESSGKGNE